jgi:hypothetical protein
MTKQRRSFLKRVAQYIKALWITLINSTTLLSK